MSVVLTIFTEVDNGRNISARIGDVIEVTLTENATTGYRWEPDGEYSGVLQLLDVAANYPNRASGSGGDAVFRFLVAGSGSCVLTLKYWRHWEGERSTFQGFVLKIEARS